VVSEVTYYARGLPGALLLHLAFLLLHVKIQGEVHTDLSALQQAETLALLLWLLLQLLHYTAVPCSSPLPAQGLKGVEP
jgi:hypothetical protein